MNEIHIRFVSCLSVMSVLFCIVEVRHIFMNGERNVYCIQRPLYYLLTFLCVPVHYIHYILCMLPRISLAFQRRPDSKVGLMTPVHLWLPGSIEVNRVATLIGVF